MFDRGMDGAAEHQAGGDKGRPQPGHVLEVPAEWTRLEGAHLRVAEVVPAGQPLGYGVGRRRFDRQVDHRDLPAGSGIGRAFRASIRVLASGSESRSSPTPKWSRAAESASR